MGYDRGDSFPLDFEPNGNPFGSKSKGKLSPQPYPIRFEGKWKYIFLSITILSQDNHVANMILFYNILSLILPLVN